MKHMIFSAVMACAASMAAGSAGADEAQSFGAAYTVQVAGFQGAFSLNIEREGARYKATAVRRTDGLARALIGDGQDYRYAARGLVGAKNLNPIAYEHQGGKRKRLVQVKFDGRNIVTQAEPPMSMGNPPATSEQKQGALDFLSFFVAATLAPGADQPCQGKLRVFDGRALFDLALAPAGRERVSTRAWKGEAYRCSVQYTPIAGYREPVKPAKLSFLFAPRERGWFAPLRIEMPTEEAGIVRLEAKKFSFARAS